MATSSSQQTYAQSAGSVKSIPIVINQNKDISDKIIKISDVGIIENKFIKKELEDFYKHIMLCSFEHIKDPSDKTPMESMKDYFKKEFKNIIYKSKTEKTTDPSSSIIFSNYDDNDTKGFNNLAYITDTYELIDYNFNKSSDEGHPTSDELVTSIQDILDGTCIIMVIKNGHRSIRTTRTFDGSGKYDSDKSHVELFEGICKDKNIVFSNFIEYSKETPTISYCFHLGIQLNDTPFPKAIPNDIFLLKAFLINGKKYQLDVFNHKISDLDIIKENAEECDKKICDINKFIKEELTVDYIKQLDTEDIISLFANLKCGIIRTPATYSYNSSDKVLDQIDTFMKLQTRDFKGLYIETDKGTKYDIINFKYSEMSKIRIQYSIEPSQENDKNLFLQYLHLLYKNNEQELYAIETNTTIYKKDLISSKFYEVYGEEKYKPILSEIQNKLTEYFDMMYDTYMQVYKDKSIDKYQIPPCFRYYNMKESRKENVINKIHYDIYFNGKRSNPRFVVQKCHIKEYMLNVVLKQYYEENMTKTYGKKTLFVYTDLNSRILRPILKYEHKQSVVKKPTFNLL